MTPNPESEELKPCPFCGGEAGVEGLRGDGYGRIAAVCQNCGARGSAFDEKRTDVDYEVKAIEAWNNRASKHKGD